MFYQTEAVPLIDDKPQKLCEQIWIYKQQMRGVQRRFALAISRCLHVK